MTELTHVELEWVKGRIENWIRFGRTAEQRIVDSQRRVVSFAPGNVFAFIRWAANDYGTVLSRIDILRAVVPGEPASLDSRYFGPLPMSAVVGRAIPLWTFEEQ